MAMLFCVRCRRKYPATAKVWRCECGGLLDLKFKAEFPLDKIKDRALNMWRYREALPVNNDKNIAAIKKSRDEIVAVSDQEVVAAIEQMGRLGFYIEPTAAATIAGVKKYFLCSRSKEMIVSIITGHGLKAC